ncbi:hypothetical protein ACEUZ9_000983 [Paracoccus litorisediminis]|uniref:hypothetical protein n=1 Tax=Paracoccus litorisediminis TaxID=2006130 RepID=UPI00373465E5
MNRFPSRVLPGASIDVTADLGILVEHFMLPAEVIGRRPWLVFGLFFGALSVPVGYMLGSERHHQMMLGHHGVNGLAALLTFESIAMQVARVSAITASAIAGLVAVLTRLVGLPALSGPALTMAWIMLSLGITILGKEITCKWLLLRRADAVGGR